MAAPATLGAPAPIAPLAPAIAGAPLECMLPPTFVRGTLFTVVTCSAADDAKTRYQSQ